MAFATRRNICLAAMLPVLGAAGKVDIQGKIHDIQQIQPSAFDDITGKFGDSAVLSVWFFKEDNYDDQIVLDEYNKVATDMKGMAKVTAISCTEFPNFCEEQGVKETPTVMIYTRKPVRSFKFEGKLEQKRIAGKIARLMPDKVTRLTKKTADTFLSSRPSQPKLLLFSKEKFVPTTWKALSVDTVFKRTVNFGFVSEDESDIVQRFKVKNFPTVIMQRGAKGETRETYKGGLKFLDIKDFINPYAESRMGEKMAGPGGGNEESMEEAKPWLVQEVPELTLKSYDDVCFKGEWLCVIYLKDGEAVQADIDMLASLSEKFTSQLSDRVPKTKWMWINLALESKYKELFQPAQLPSAVVFDPRNRLRFAAMDPQIMCDQEGLEKLMDEVLGGHARFKMVPDQKLPAWAQREAPAGKKPEIRL